MYKWCSWYVYSNRAIIQPPTRWHSNLCTHRTHKTCVSYAVSVRKSQTEPLVCRPFQCLTTEIRPSPCVSTWWWLEFTTCFDDAELRLTISRLRKAAYNANMKVSSLLAQPLRRNLLFSNIQGFIRLVSDDWFHNPIFPPTARKIASPASA